MFVMEEVCLDLTCENLTVEMELSYQLLIQLLIEMMGILRMVMVEAVGEKSKKTGFEREAM